MAMGRGRVVKAQARHIHGVRELAREELTRLTQTRSRIAPHVQKLRDSHHNVARLCAMGLRNYEIAIRSGYSMVRVSNLQRDPSFQSLVEYYRGLVNESFKASADEYMDIVTSNMMKAERLIADRLEQADEEETPLPLNQLIAISRDGADRTGRGKTQTTVNVNVDFAASLEKAIDRSNKAKVIEGEVISTRRSV